MMCFRWKKNDDRSIVGQQYVKEDQVEIAMERITLRLLANHLSWAHFSRLPNEGLQYSAACNVLSSSSFLRLYKRLLGINEISAMIK